MFWSSCSSFGIVMEGSSESAWQESGSSRGLNSSGVSDRNRRVISANRIGFSGDASHDSVVRKERGRVVLAHHDFKNQGGLCGVCEEEVAVDPFVRAIEWGDISLRQWLDKPERTVDVFECLHIFRQIVEIVNAAHSQGIVVHNVRPSCFVMSSFNHVSFIESASCSDSGSDSLEEGSNSRSVEVKNSSSSLPHDAHQHRSSLGSEDFRSEMTPTNALSETTCMQSSSVYAAHLALIEETEENKEKDRGEVEEVEEKKQPFPMKQILHIETSWYTSPEEVASSPSSCASDIYCLGVLLFEVHRKHSQILF